MSKRKQTKLIHEGSCVAEVDVELLEEPRNGHRIFLLKTRIVSMMYGRLFDGAT